MLRELTMDEMEMVSGGEDEVIVTGTRRSSPLTPLPFRWMSSLPLTDIGGMMRGIFDNTHDSVGGDIAALAAGAYAGIAAGATAATLTGGNVHATAVAGAAGGQVGSELGRDAFATATSLGLGAVAATASVVSNPSQVVPFIQNQE